MKKTYFKKALSLIMAVMMIMSCWVWVAPQKASAVVGEYDVTITFNLEDDDAVGGHVIIWYFPLKSDGSGFDTSKTDTKFTVEDSLAKAAAKDHTYTETIPGWPWRLELKIDDTDLFDETYLDLKYFKIGNKEIITSSIGNFQNAICYFDYNGTFTPHDENGKSIGADAGRVDSITGEGFTWPFPDAETITWSNTPEAMQCPESNSATQTVAVSALDQYGVELYNPTWSVKGSVCGTTGISVSSGTSNAASTSIQLTNAANNTTATDTQTGTVTATWGSVSDSKTFTITDSYYTATFNYETQNDDLVTSSTATEKREGYHGDTITAPTAPSYYDGDYLKTFSAWSPAFASTITKDVTYTATYTSKFIEADYTAVDDAIAAANAVKAQYGTEYELKYTLASRVALDNAINAVVRDLGRTQQTTVDGYAQAINDAIAGLKSNTFAVIFLDRFGAILKYDKEAEYKENIAAPDFPEDQKSYFDAENHYTYDGWDSDEYTSVLDDLVIAPVYKAEAHDWEIETVTSTCVQAGTQKYTCKVCGYVKYDGGDQLGDHVWNSDFTVDLEPTCTLPGSKSIHCTLCDARKDETVVPAKGHQWGTVSSLAPATCDRDGIDTRLCDECGVCEHVLVPASGHNYVKTTVAPTCTAKGYDEYVCQNENCGSSYRDNYTDIIDHPYGEWQTVSEAHCGIAGVKKQTCSECGYINLGSIDALEHKVPDNWTVITNPTCEGTGYQVKKCTLCDVVLEEGTIPAKNHDYKVTSETSATCITAGVKTETCANCGDVNKTVTQAAGHNFDAGVTSQADCTHGGFKVYTCQNANCGYKKYELINGALANGHKFEGGVEEVVTPATCTTDGQKTVQCVNDGCEYKITKVIPKLGHDMKAGTAVDATCTTSGYTPYTCENKNCTYTYNVYNADVQAKGHSFKETGRTDATCTVDGSVSYKCERCDETKTETLPKLGHKYEKQSETTATCTAPATETYKCANCQDTYVKYVEASLAHDWSGEWTVVKAATDKETGLKIKKCANCDAEKSEVIPTIGAHVYTSEITTAATCTTDGLRTYTCSAHANCSYTEVIPATGHKAKLVYVAATCTSKGSSKVVCATCNTELVEATEIPMLAHTYGTGTETTPATCTENGVMTYTCTASGCGAQRTEVIPRTGHSLSSQYNPATCETAGFVTTSCAKCSYSTTQDIPAMGHKLTVTVVDATCSEAGSVTEDCSRCDYVKVTDIAIKNHLYNGTETIVKEATCTENGEKTIKCATCDVVTKVIIPMTGHAWGEYTTTPATCETDGKKVAECTNENCNATDEIIIPKLGHNYGAWEVVKAATNSEDGEWKRVCANCGDVEKLTIPAGGHDFKNAPTVTEEATCTKEGTAVYKCSVHANCGVTLTVTIPVKQHTIVTDKKDATCTEMGYVKTLCSVCKEIFTNEVREKIAHVYVPGSPVPATCTTSGYTPYTCKCGDAYNKYNENDKATGHSLVEGTSTATCTGEGLMTLTCQACTYSTTVKVPALGHNYVEDTAAATSATCAAAATKTYKCSRCTENYTISVGEKTTNHSFGAWEVKKSATESSIGYKTRTCSVCQLVEFQIIDALGEHVFKEDSRTEPTCTEKGVINYICDTHNDCGKTDTVEIPATGHNYIGVETTAPTCEGEGEITYTCQNDNNHTYTEKIPALGHSYGEGTVTPATCKDTGKIEYKCTRTGCNDIHEVTLATNANAHQYATTVVEATCTDNGSVVTKCTLCDKVTTNETLAAKGHYFTGEETQTEAPTCTADGTKNVKCKFCDVTTEVAVPKNGHSFGDWKKTDATNDNDGKWERECSVCHKTETLIIPAGGHNLVKDTVNSKTPSCNEKGVEVYYCNAHTNCSVRVTVELDYAQHDIKLVTKEASCTETGTISVACDNCNKDFGIVETLPVKAHNFVAQTAVAPTCTTSGYTPYKCENCKASYNVYDDSKPATGHTFDETITANVTTVDATCTADGSKTVKCKDCDVTNTVVLPKKDHTYTATEKAATCTTAATKTYTCSCGSKYIEFTSEAKGHTYGEWTEIQAPTDKAYGIKKRVCACGAEEFATVAPIGDHNFVGVVTKDPTCTETGIKTFTCQNHTTCQSYTEVIPALGHSQTLKYTAATCTTPGSTKIVCSVESCKAEIASEVIPALGHAWNDGTVTKATCTAEGKIEYACTRTGCTGTKVTTIARDFTAHDYVTTITQPSCTKEGSIVVKCSRQGCPSNPVNQTLPKKEHTWGTPVVNNATCTEYGSKVYTCTADGCGEKKTEVIEKLGHNYGDWSVTKASTNSGNGVLSRVCQNNNNHIETVEFPAGGHNLVVSSKTDATCTATGSVTYDCDAHTGANDCGISITVTLDKKQHTFTTTKKDATCLADGEVLTACACGETYRTVIPATGHTYDDGVKTPATCTKEGKIVYTCTADGCNDTREVVLEKLQHNYVAGTPVDATCTSSGYTPYKCATCDSNYVIVTSNANGHTYNKVVGSTATCLTAGTMTLECACGAQMITDVPALGHDYKLDSTTNATCAAAATETYKCSRCTASYTISVGSKTTVHDWNDWVVVEKPTYTSVGYQTRTCKTCEKLEVMTLDATGDHKFIDGEVIETKAATCTEDGYEIHKCSIHTGENECGETQKFTLSKLGHNEEIQYNAATCTTDGYVNIYCDRCKTTLKTQTIDKLDHLWGNESITLSDCKTNGKVEFTCTRSGCTETHTVTLPLNADAHTVVKTVNDATCTAEGSVVTSCSKCGKELTRTVLPVVPHQWGVWTVTKASTNNAEGEMTRTCDNGCTETVKFPAGGHTFGNVPNSTEPATCTKEGTATYKCTAHANCGVEITVTLAKVQHTFVTEKEDATCTTEGFVKVYCNADGCTETLADVTTGKLAHDFEVVETVAPDCNTSGYKVYKCKNCNESYKQIDADALAHNYEEVANSSTADCVNSGTKTLKCKDCGKEITVTVPALGHDWVTGDITNPTCKDKGTISFECSRCDATRTEELPTISHELTTVTTDATCTADGSVVTTCKYCDYKEEKTIAKKGHTWADAPVADKTVKATCEAEGSETYECVNCDATNVVTIPALGHVYQAGNKVDPTCTTSGYTVYVCKNDESHKYNVYDASQPAKGHSFGEWTVVTNATETTEGLKERKCACGEKETEVIPAMMHNMVEVTTDYVAPTCTQEGQRVYKCDTKHDGVVCTYTLTVELPKIAHTLDTNVTDATCTDAGKVVTTCTKCNTVNIESTIPAMGHAWDEGQVTTAASCTAEGVITFTCQHDASHTYTKPIEMKQHNFKAGKEVAATCTENAYIPYKCENCDESYVIITGDATGHKYLIGDSTATCEKGGTITITCENSGCKEVIVIAVDALGHDWGTGTVTKQPTCSEKGAIEYTCARCGGKKTDILDNKDIDHDYVTVTTDATCVEDGSVVTTCSHCNYKKTEVIKAKGHTWAETPESKVEATCETKGSATYKCVNCDERKTVEIPALGHVYEAKETVAPTCTTSGYTVYVCKNDESHKYNVYDASKPAVPHTFSDWAVVTNATQDTDGLERRTCSNCDAVEEKVIPAMKHNMVVVSTKDATCIAEGEIVYECKTNHDGVVCNYTLTVTASKIAHTLKTTVVNATCETAGSVVTSCEKCNTVNETTVLPALGHKYVGTVTTPAGCETNGVMTYICQNDAKHTYTEVIPAKGHSYTPVLTAPTCTAEGYTTYTCDCGHSYVGDKVAALGHNFGSWTNVNNDEVHQRNCSRCSVTETEAHRWDNGKVIVEPTYDTVGKTLYTCGVCGATKIEGIETNVDNNAPTGEIKWNATLWNDFLSVITFGTYVNYDVVLEITAKDEETGVKSIEYYVSDKALALDAVKALASWTAYDSANKLTVSAVDAEKFVVYAKITDNKGNVTYLSTDGIVFDTAAPGLSIEADKGNAQTNVYCSNVTVVIDDANISHAIYDGKTVALTTDKFFCNEIGTHTVTVFDKAGNSAEITFTINNGHTWTQAPLSDNSNLKSAATCDDKAVYYAACSVCGELDKSTTFEYGDAFGHDYVGTVTTPATCENDGVKTYICQNDNSHTYTEVVPATGHTESAAVQENLVAAKCEKNGSYDMVVYCAVCGKELSRTSHVISATGHDYEGTVTKAPTCTESGVMTYVCANDYTHAYSERISALGHTDANNDCTCEVCGEKCCKHSDLYVKTYDPTCTVNGKAVLKCKNCEREEVTILPALGHKEVVTYVDATCSEFAYKITKCENCDELNEKVYTDNAYAKHSVVVIPGKPATCVSDGYTAYERCVSCGMVTEAKTLYKEDVPHVDEDSNGKCDTCGGQFFTDTQTCNCLCHGTGIKGFLYKIAVFFWKIFKMNKSCACGNVHY